MLTVNEYFDGHVKSIASPTHRKDESFEIDADSGFDVKVDNEAVYLCLYG
ncbi:MAG: hypothetical protein PF589_09690 [Gammaproteobacteria bacterium]|jgi:uncharacterized protein YaiE (UPF0345 family)|nr:hypothetical protein [Gammaproteobacteria bacterium]